MSDNTPITPGAGANVATDNVGGVHFQRVKIAHGPDGVAADVTPTSPLPIDMVARPSYQAVYRAAARPYALSKVFTAGSRFQIATLHHPASAVKTVRIVRVMVAISASTVAAIIAADLNFINGAPVTGNPAIPIVPTNRGNPASECVALALPTTAGAQGELLATTQWNLGITGAASVINPPPPINWVMLYEGNSQHEEEVIRLRPGVLEGVAVTLDVNAASTVTSLVIIEFTEA